MVFRVRCVCTRRPLALLAPTRPFASTASNPTASPRKNRGGLLYGLTRRSFASTASDAAAARPRRNRGGVLYELTRAETPERLLGHFDRHDGTDLMDHRAVSAIWNRLGKMRATARSLDRAPLRRLRSRTLALVPALPFL